MPSSKCFTKYKLHLNPFQEPLPSPSDLTSRILALLVAAYLQEIPSKLISCCSILKILQQHMNQRLPSDLITEATWLVMRLKHADTPQQLISQIGNLAEGTLRWAFATGPTFLLYNTCSENWLSLLRVKSCNRPSYPYNLFLTCSNALVCQRCVLYLKSSSSLSRLL